MLIERDVFSGAWVISELIGDYLETRRYYGYTKAEARAEFRAEFPKRPRTGRGAVSNDR